MTMSDIKEDKNMQDVCDLLQASRTHKLFIPEVDRSGTLTELQSEMLSWIWNVDSREHANSDSPTGLTDLQKEMLRWISHSNSIQIAMHNKPSTPEKIDDVHTVTLANIVTVVKEDTDGYVDVEEISSKHVHDQSDSDSFDGDGYLSFLTGELKYRDMSPAIEKDIDEIPSIMSHMDKVRQKDMVLRQKAAIAIVLADRLNREVRTDDPEVQEALFKTEIMARKINFKMITQLRKEDTEASVDFKPPSWTMIKKKVKIRYANILEKKLRRKYGLNIERCKKNWLALQLLHAAHKNTVSRIKHYHSLNKV